jgi:hypothetical protein
MKQINKIMHLTVALFFAVSLVFFLSFNSLKGLFGIEELNSGTVVSFLLVGTVLFLIAWGTGKMVRNGLEGELSLKENEKKELKAKLYDLEQGVKLKNIERKIDQVEDDKDPSVIKPRQNFK